MKPVRTSVLTILLIACAAMAAFSQNDVKPSVVTMAKSKFASLPAVPACLTLSPQSGDPSKGESLLLIKMKANCVVPWHWHTATEHLMFVSGKGRIEMKGETAQAVAGGDFVDLPSKHVHQFTCVSGCVFFDHTSAAFDVHYVDKDGREIPVEQALKAPPKAKPSKAPSK